VQTHRARRIVAAEWRGSSLPVVVETDAGPFVTKLRGAAQGTAALVAEIVVASLAEAIGLRVPERALVALDPGVACDDRHAELADLLGRSRGTNLGFRLLEGARDLRPGDVARVGRDLASAIAWLDGLVMNPDRTPRNPNLLVDERDLWLIDHGAALPFQHDWASLTEESPRAAAAPPSRHVLHERASAVDEWDPLLAAALDRDRLRAAVSEVPDDFLSPLLPPSAGVAALPRRRDAYVAFLWKRLRPPRPFVRAGLHAASAAGGAAPGAL